MTVVDVAAVEVVAADVVVVDVASSGEIVALEADAAVATLEEVPAAVSALSNAVVPAVVSMLPMRLPSQHSEEHKRPYHSTTHGKPLLSKACTFVDDASLMQCLTNSHSRVLAK